MLEFSVAICVYFKDDAFYFKSALESITIDQIIKPKEVVIVVDGPVYGELYKVLNKIDGMDPLYKVIWLSSNVGHAKARQQGLIASTSDIVAIMDADDISDPKRFELQLKAFKEHPEVTVVGGQIREFIDTPENVVGERIVPCDDSTIKHYLKSRCPMNLVTVMYRKKDIQAVGGFMDWYCEEDYYLWIRLAKAGYKFYNLDETLVNVRVGKEMYQRRGGWKYFKSEARLQWYMLNNGIISLPRYVYNTLGRFVVQVAMPNKLRGFVFQKLFRK